MEEKETSKFKKEIISYSNPHVFILGKTGIGREFRTQSPVSFLKKVR
ncbi:TPA: hypothetical protein U1C30_002148 [Streptococcus suis]|nr:hypothetical protein [Streptococcus suis]